MKWLIAANIVLTLALLVAVVFTFLNIGIINDNLWTIYSTCVPGQDS